MFVPSLSPPHPQIITSFLAVDSFTVYYTDPLKWILWHLSFLAPKFFLNQSLTEIGTRDFSWGVKAAGA